jgi:hypothetical protein
MMILLGTALAALGLWVGVIAFGCVLMLACWWRVTREDPPARSPRC